MEYAYKDKMSVAHSLTKQFLVLQDLQHFTELKFMPNTSNWGGFKQYEYESRVNL